MTLKHFASRARQGLDFVLSAVISRIKQFSMKKENETADNDEVDLVDNSSTPGSVDYRIHFDFSLITVENQLSYLEFLFQV
jgi:hypothetical protein